MGVGGKAIPSLVEKITNIRSRAEFVLLVEKDAAFMRLAEDRFYNEYPCIIITGKGQPDVSTRLFLKMIKDQLQIPILGLMDADPYGLKILSVYMCAPPLLCTAAAQTSRCPSQSPRPGTIAGARPNRRCRGERRWLQICGSSPTRGYHTERSWGSTPNSFAKRKSINVSDVGMHLYGSTLATIDVHVAPRSSSKNMSYDSAALTTSDIKWLGVRCVVTA